MTTLRSAHVQLLKIHTICGQIPLRRCGMVVTGIAAFLLLAVMARADPLRITSGAFEFNFGGEAFGDVSGPDFAIVHSESGSDEFGLRGLALAHTDRSAKRFPVSGHEILDLSGADFTLAHHSLPAECCLLLFDVTFTGPPAVAHAAPDLCPVCAVGTSPFRVTGVLTGINGFDETTEIFRHAVAGHGNATVGFTDLGPFARFDFAPGAVTPEPATLALLVTGGAGAAWRQRRRRATVRTSL